MKYSRFESSLQLIITLLMLSGVMILISCTNNTDEQEGTNKEPHIVASSQIAAGRYLAIVGGCNDCHTDGYLMSEGKVPEEDWLAGSFLGWRGPWGTTYPVNLRLAVQEMTEEEWVLIIHEREDLPPMPWVNVNQMSEQDAKALYQYIKSLGPKGEHVPEALEPGVEPETPYLSLEPQNLPQ
jgi:mono/diheme cytochrome c family protein